MRLLQHDNFKAFEMIYLEFGTGYGSRPFSLLPEGKVMELIDQ